MIEQFIKNLEHVCDLVYFDGPWISLMKDNKGEPYLMYAIEPTEWGKGWKWIVFKTSKNSLYQFLDEKLTYDELRQRREGSTILGKYGIEVCIGVERYPVPAKIVYKDIKMLQNNEEITDNQYFTEDMMKIGDLEKLEVYLGKNKKSEVFEQIYQYLNRVIDFDDSESHWSFSRANKAELLLVISRLETLVKKMRDIVNDINNSNWRDNVLYIHIFKYDYNCSMFVKIRKILRRFKNYVSEYEIIENLLWEIKMIADVKLQSFFNPILNLKSQYLTCYKEGRLDYFNYLVGKTTKCFNISFYRQGMPLIRSCKFASNFQARIRKAYWNVIAFLRKEKASDNVINRFKSLVTFK